MRFYEQFYGFHALRIVGKCTSRHLSRYGQLTARFNFLDLNSRLQGTGFLIFDAKFPRIRITRANISRIPESKLLWQRKGARHPTGLRNILLIGRFVQKGQKQPVFLQIPDKQCQVNCPTHSRIDLMWRYNINLNSMQVFTSSFL